VSNALGIEYAADGVAVVRSAVDPGSLAFFQNLATRIDRHERRLMARNGESLCDSFLWLTEPECERFLSESPLAAIAAEVMGSNCVRLYYDQLFQKVAGHSEPTRWHQDIAHWPLEGSQTCSIWLAIDPVMKEGGAVRYLSGSHAWNRLFRPWEGAPGDVPPNFDTPEYRAIERSFDLAPGDCAIHDGRTVHGSFPNLCPGTRRLAYVTRWTCDSATKALSRLTLSTFRWWTASSRRIRCLFRSSETPLPPVAHHATPLPVCSSSTTC
jgi:ectoine hydroxylase-related dioxygenase (phytanoyl-CoA dioxygenase family)